MPNSEDGVSLTTDGEDGAASPSSLTWEEVWSRIGLAADKEISTTQAELIVEAYPLDQSVEAAVDDGVLQETFFQAPTPNGASERRHGGYRLVGVVRHNTFDDRPLIARKHIGIIATNANMPPEKVGLALQAPVENQDLLRIQRHEGPREYAVVEERSVKAVLANELARDHPAPTVLAGCRSLLDGLREGS